MLHDRRACAAILACFAPALEGCNPSSETTGERSLRSTDTMELALVQVFEQRPPHTATLRHSVVCRSSATAARGGDERYGIRAGWALVGHLPDIEKPTPTPRAHADALDAAQSAAHDGLLLGDGWLAWHSGSRLEFTFDDCATWGRFHPAESLPLSEIDMSTVKFRCEPSDCAGVAMDLPHAMEVTDLQVAPPSVAFTVHSRALKDGGERRVESHDGGRTWQVR